jgi:plastocyanin
MHAVRFDPDSLAVAAGDTVTWDNRDIVPHTSTAEDGAWSSPAIAPDSSWSVVILTPGLHPYHCAFHPAMKARLRARPR